MSALSVTFHFVPRSVSKLLSMIFSKGMSAGQVIFIIVLIIATYYARAVIFRKAGEPGIAAIIPVYSEYILAKIVFGNGLWFLLYLIPVIRWVVPFVMLYKLGKSFGKEFGFCLGLVLFSPIFLMILAFSDDHYLGPNN